MIRSATPADIPAIAQLIRDLAEYEKLVHEVSLDESMLREHLFGPRPYAELLIADEAEAVGFALFFMNYSTFRARPGIYLEDLYVKPNHRGRGIGKALFTSVARLAIERQCSRFEWSVLDWNTPSINFYKAMGAKPLDDWTTYRLDGDALQALGCV